MADGQRVFVEFYERESDDGSVAPLKARANCQLVLSPVECFNIGGLILAQQIIRFEQI